MKFQQTTGSTLSKHFVKLKDGSAVVGIFAGEPFEFKTHFIENKGQVCVGEVCTACKAGNKPKFRFRVNLIVANEEKKMEAKIFEQGWKVYGALGALNKEYPIDKNFIKIMRSGEKLDTVYTLLPVAVKPSEDTLRALSDVKLLPTDPMDSFWTRDEHGDAFEDNEVPF